MSPALSPDQVEKARQMRANGATYAVIAAQFGVSVSGVHYRLDPRTPDTKPAKYRRLTPGQVEQVRAMRAAGVAVNEIAAQFQIRPDTVSYHTANRETKQEQQPEPTPDELLLSAFPWAYTLPLAAREQFAHELAHRPKYEFERDLDLFISRWHHRAEKRAS